MWMPVVLWLGASQCAQAEAPTDEVAGLNTRCQAGHSVDCAALGQKYADGKGVSRDLSKALALFSRGCDLGSEVSCRAAAQAVLAGSVGEAAPVGLAGEPSRVPDADAAQRFRQKARAILWEHCTQGGGQECLLLSRLEEYGELQGAPGESAQLVSRAIGLLDDACQSGAGADCATLGQLLLEGRYIVRDRPRALEVLDRGCAAGSLLACTHASLEYLAGEPESMRDPRRAIPYLERMCELGRGDACVRGGLERERVDSSSASLAQAARLYERACRECSAEGCYRQGLLVEQGGGVRRDSALADELLRKACSMGSADACEHVGASLGAPLKPESRPK